MTEKMTLEDVTTSKHLDTLYLKDAHLLGLSPEAAREFFLSTYSNKLHALVFELALELRSGYLRTDSYELEPIHFCTAAGLLKEAIDKAVTEETARCTKYIDHVGA